MVSTRRSRTRAHISYREGDKVEIVRADRVEIGTLLRKKPTSPSVGSHKHPIHWIVSIDASSVNGQTHAVAANSPRKEEDISELVLGRVLDTPVALESAVSDTSEVSAAAALAAAAKFATVTTTNAIKKTVIAKTTATTTTTTLKPLAKKFRGRPIKKSLPKKRKGGKSTRGFASHAFHSSMKNSNNNNNKKVAKTETITTNSKGETVTKVRMLTGTLVLYRGPDGRKLRVEFNRSK